MKKINVRFEKEKALNDIEIVIRADKRDEQINALIERLTHNETVRLTVLDMNNCPSVIDEKEIVFPKYCPECGSLIEKVESLIKDDEAFKGLGIEDEEEDDSLSGETVSDEDLLNDEE